jgi:hypothetical protein
VFTAAVTDDAVGADWDSAQAADCAIGDLKKPPSSMRVCRTSRGSSESQELHGVEQNIFDLAILGCRSWI